MEEEKKKISMTDDGGHFWLGSKLFKIKRWVASSKKDRLKGIHTAEYVEVDPVEYDARVERLTKEIASSPGVDLLDVLRDALYDISLTHLSRIEKALEKEQQKKEPKIRTRRGERGTCVELRVGGRFGLDLRA